MVAMNLAFTESGTGAPLVVLHGLFGGARNWGRVARDLATEFHVTAVDLPNHGESPWQDRVTYEDMAEAMAEFLRARGIAGTATLLGHSMGGKVAMTLALRSPRDVARLIVIDIAPVAYDHARTNTHIIEALRSLPLARLASRKEADAALAAEIPDPMLRGFLLANLARENDRFVWRINLDGLANSLPALHGFPELPADARYEGPTLFIVGERSDYVAESDKATIRRRFPSARIEAVAGTGHWVHADAPDAVVRLVSDFIRGD
jgi:pimeloyl-ACP methyl ester carboxylesterase